MRSIRHICVAAAAVLAAQVASAALVNISSSEHFAIVWDSVEVQSSTDDLRAIPTSATATANVGATSASTQVSYTTTDGQTLLSGSATLARSGSLSATGYARGQIYFTVAEDTPYALSGAATADDSTVAGRFFLRGALLDLTSGQHLFYSYQESRSTLDESFSLGAMSGDHSNNKIGEMTGMLVASRTYFFEYGMYAQSSSRLNPGTAEGFVTLTIGEREAAGGVPEPAVWALLLAGGVGHVASRRRARRSGRSAPSALPTGPLPT